MDVLKHFGLAMSVMLRMRRASEDPEELLSIALLALVQAGCDYDPDRAKFSTFACDRIEYAILRHRRDQLLPCRDRRRTVTLSDDVVRWHGAAAEPSEFEREDAEQDARDRLRVLLRGLPAEYKAMVLMRASGATHAEVGQAFGVSKERSRQVEEIVLRQARKRAGASSTLSIGEVQLRARQRHDRLRPNRRFKPRPYGVGERSDGAGVGV